LASGLPAFGAEPIKIGLVTALSGQSAKAGEAITRGLTIAIDEINANGGVLGGQKFELVRRDDEANPAKGLHFHIEVDGGIDALTAARCAKAGANVMVAGSSVMSITGRCDIGKLKFQKLKVKR